MYHGTVPSQIMVTTIGLTLAAGRFGLAPTAKKVASASLKLTDRNVDLQTSDPAGVSHSCFLFKKYDYVTHVLTRRLKQLWSFGYMSFLHSFTESLFFYFFTVHRC